MKEALKKLNTPLSRCPYIIHLHPHTTSLSDVPPGEKVMFVLREPISRYLSGFYSRKREGRPKYFNPWNEDERKAFNRFKTPNELALALSSSDLDLRAQAHHAMSTVRHIKDTYTETFGSIEYIKRRCDDILFIGFQESLDADFARLTRALNVQDKIFLPRDDVLAHRSPGGVDKHLDVDAIENLRKWYSEDSKLLEFCRLHNGI